MGSGLKVCCRMYQMASGTASYGPKKRSQPGRRAWRAILQGRRDGDSISPANCVRQARGALEGGGRTAQESYPFLTPGCDTPQRFPGLRQRTQLVMLSHQILVTGVFEGTNRSDNDLAQVQWGIPRRSTTRALHVLQPGGYGIAIELSRTTHNCLRLIALGGRNKFTLGIIFVLDGYKGTVVSITTTSVFDEFLNRVFCWERADDPSS
jgi:hypothetical protein